MLGLIFKNWRIVAAGAVVIAVVGAGWYIKRQIWQGGFKACEMAQAEKIKELTAKARLSIVEQGKTYEKTIQELTRRGDTGYGVGDRTADILDRLHERAR